MKRGSRSGRRRCSHADQSPGRMNRRARPTRCRKASQKAQRTPGAQEEPCTDSRRGVPGWHRKT
eukprot:7756409-Heterocapsa_arctica.AAC.1